MVCCFSLLFEGLCLGLVGEVFVPRVIADGKVTVPSRARDVLGIEKGDYVRVTTTEVIKKKQTQQKARTKRRK